MSPVAAAQQLQQAAPLHLPVAAAAAAAAATTASLQAVAAAASSGWRQITAAQLCQQLVQLCKRCEKCLLSALPQPRHAAGQCAVAVK
jgi:hypothetical protein